MKQLTEVQMQEITHLSNVLGFSVLTQSNNSVLLQLNGSHVTINKESKVRYSGTFRRISKHKATIEYSTSEFYKVVDHIYDTFSRR